ncbi:hypothetical protein BB560_003094 [Smittium megazygosporum]|uniref:Uncharacterized protein n=1 Tax=Smittium megazygosporum TaxID=133381 RepID=A0A2T9ZCX7_9FUNG|nr:hypothetical protein BB560_003094 [Smittium megazygosporum]
MSVIVLWLSSCMFNSLDNAPLHDNLRVQRPKYCDVNKEMDALGLGNRAKKLESNINVPKAGLEKEASKVKETSEKCIQTMCGKVSLPSKEVSDWCDSTTCHYKEMYSKQADNEKNTKDYTSY